ncbi:hypothetical protein BYT27DRAFT_7184634 [Phlegmacium glaucopus]|nr:hypothetical protein BYT27DRAFT_7184634 [Phlegmacium glaucopus]
MSTLLPPDIPPDMGAIAGPLLIGYLLKWGLFGVLSVQVYVYYLALSTDPFQRKALVYAVFAAELVQTILYSKMAFKEFAAGFGNFEAFDQTGLLWFAAPILSSIVGFVVQIFYAYRIKLLSESYVVAVVVVLFAVVSLGGGIAEGVIAHMIPSFSSNVEVLQINIATGIWNGASAMCDIIIAASMTYYLSRWRTNWKPTQRIIQRLTRLIVGTGTLTAAVAITNLVLFVLPGHQLTYQTSSAILGNLYSCTMMVVLNSRIVFSQKESGSSDLSSSLASNTDMAPIRRPPVFVAHDSSHDSIAMTHEQSTIPLAPEAYV